MKKGVKLAVAIFEIVIGLFAVASFIIIAASGENMLKWIITLLLAVSYVVIGTIELIGIVKNKE